MGLCRLFLTLSVSVTLSLLSYSQPFSLPVSVCLSVSPSTPDANTMTDETKEATTIVEPTIPRGQSFIVSHLPNLIPSKWSAIFGLNTSSDGELTPFSSAEC